MSKMIGGLVVTFTDPVNEEYAGRVIDAIKLIQYVATVEPRTDNIDLQIASARVHTELADRVFSAFYPNARPDDPRKNGR